MITRSLKILKVDIIAVSMEIIDKADSLSFAILLRRKDLTLFSVEKHLSASDEDMGIVIRILRSLIVSEIVDERPLSIKIDSKATIPCPEGKWKSSREYRTLSYIFSFFS